MNYTEIEGDLIKESLTGKFDVIAHCCNCFCVMGAGIAVPMAKTFGCNGFEKEGKEYQGDINKLGTIDYEKFFLVTNFNGVTIPVKANTMINHNNHPNLIAVNLYGQYGLGGKFGNSPSGTPFDMNAFTMGLRKMNHIFKGKHIGLPKFIGCGLAGGDWTLVEQIIKFELKDCDVTIVYLPKREDVGNWRF